MLISIEGPVTPDIRDGTAAEEAQLVSLTKLMRFGSESLAAFDLNMRLWTYSLFVAGLLGYCDHVCTTRSE